MENVGIPIIVIICYMIGEAYKLIFKNKETYKIIPIITTLAGGVIGVILYVSLFLKISLYASPII